MNQPTPFRSKHKMSDDDLRLRTLERRIYDLEGRMEQLIVLFSNNHMSHWKAATKLKQYREEGRC